MVGEGIERRDGFWCCTDANEVAARGKGPRHRAGAVAVGSVVVLGEHVAGFIQDLNVAIHQFQRAGTVPEIERVGAHRGKAIRADRYGNQVFVASRRDLAEIRIDIGVGSVGVLIGLGF